MAIEDVKGFKPVVHNLNCAKLLKRRPGDPSNPCSCGVERLDGEPRPQSLDDVSGEEWNKASADYRSKIQARSWEQANRENLQAVQPPYSERDLERMNHGEPPVGPPVDSEDLGATLTRWWVEKAQEEASALVPKAVEYGGAHRAQDLLDTGARMADLLGLKDLSEGQLQELAIYFYLVGKFGRWTAAIKEGRSVSDDTLLDIGIYTKMVQRIRQKGGWPV